MIPEQEYVNYFYDKFEGRVAIGVGGQLGADVLDGGQGLLAVVPEVVAIDLVVGEIQTDVVGVVPSFSFDLLKGPAARYGDTRGRAQRIENGLGEQDVSGRQRLGRIDLADVAGEELAIDEDVNRTGGRVKCHLGLAGGRDGQDEG